MQWCECVVLCTSADVQMYCLYHGKQRSLTECLSLLGACHLQGAMMAEVIPMPETGTLFIQLGCRGCTSGAYHPRREIPESIWGVVGVPTFERIHFSCSSLFT